MGQTTARDVNDLVTFLQKYKQNRKMTLQAAAGSAVGEVEEYLRLTLDKIAEMRNEIAQFDAAVKNALPLMNQIEQRAKADLQAVSTAQGSLQSLHKEQAMAISNLIQRIDYAVDGVLALQSELRTKGYDHLLAVNGKPAATTINEKCVAIRRALEAMHGRLSDKRHKTTFDYQK